MAVVPILRWPDARLSTVCDPVAEATDMTDAIADLFDTMYAAPGRGLAGPQVGLMRRIFVTDTNWKDGPATPIVFINPVLAACADHLAEHQEGCLSIPGVQVSVARPAWVTMVWRDGDGAARQQRFDGFAAACVQHELDHLDGVVTFDRLAPQARQAAKAAYAGVQT